MEKIDLDNLFGGNAFTISCSLAFKDKVITSISNLPDSEANGFAFINSVTAEAASRFFQVKPRMLNHSIVAKGYDGKPSFTVGQVIVLDLLLDGRKLHNIPFLILNLGNHDMILGAKWMDYFDIAPDLRRKRLIWPQNIPLDPPCFAKQIKLPLHVLLHNPTPNPKHQLDVIRRAKKFEKEDKRILDGKNSGRVSNILSKQKKHDTNYANNHNPYKFILKQKPVNLNNSGKFHDIKEINTAELHLDLRNDENLLITTSVNEIDRELVNGNIPVSDSENELKEIYDKLPDFLKETDYFIEDFSRAASDTLPPHRTYDHKIELVADNSLKHGPLYSQTTEELAALKKYIVENVNKGFIEPSKAPFSSPVLFVKKKTVLYVFVLTFAN